MYFLLRPLSRSCNKYYHLWVWLLVFISLCFCNQGGIEFPMINQIIIPGHRAPPVRQDTLRGAHSAQCHCIVYRTTFLTLWTLYPGSLRSACWIIGIWLGVDTPAPPRMWPVSTRCHGSWTSHQACVPALIPHQDGTRERPVELWTRFLYPYTF